MDDMLEKFSEAAKIISSNKNPLRKSVYGAYVNYLSDINTEDLPEDIQIIYDQKIPHLQYAGSIDCSHGRHNIRLAPLGKSGGPFFIPTMEHTVQSFLGYTVSLPRSAY